MQYGALPYRFTKSGAPEILLVTTRQTKRWIIPKGWPIKGLKPAKSAAREAYEEAGVRGSVKTKAIGIFSYEKRSDDDGITIPCDVRVFPLLVKRKSQTWPESEQRVAQWSPRSSKAGLRVRSPSKRCRYHRRTYRSSNASDRLAYRILPAPRELSKLVVYRAHRVGPR